MSKVDFVGVVNPIINNFTVYVTRPLKNKPRVKKVVGTYSIPFIKPEEHKKRKMIDIYG